MENFRIIPVGALAVNCYLVFLEKSKLLLVVDPGDDADLIVSAAKSFAYERAVILLTHAHVDHIGAVVLLVTDGPNGAYFAKDGQIGHVPGLAVKAIDTSGAGDIFFGSFLYELIKSQKAPHDLTYEDLQAFCQRAVRLSGYSVLKKGAIPSIPDYNV